MVQWKKNITLIKLMILEEYRMNASMIGKFQFLFFPVLITVFALVLSISSPVMLKSMSINHIYFIFHSIIMLYGLGVGGFALFGDSIAERRFGQLNFLLATPILQPIDFKNIFMVFYIKDTIYYILFSIVPLILGMALSIPITGFNIVSVMLLLLTISLTFILGLSLSFFLSAIYVRWKLIFNVLMTILLFTIIIGLLSDYFSIEILIPPLMFINNGEPIYLGLTLLLIFIFSTFAVKFIKVEFGRQSVRSAAMILQTKEQFTFAKGYSTFIAKEWLDMKRSKTLYPVIGAYIGPLTFLALLLWFLQAVLEIPLDFNIIFYSVMVGFFGMTIYSWLNIIDNPAFYEVLPVSVSLLIKTKLMLFTILTTAISTVFLVIISLLNLQLHLLWLALIVSFTTTSYTVIATAFLTGLRTNTYLFSPGILGKFTALVALPLILITITSFLLADHFLLSLALIGGILLALIAGMIFMYSRLDRIWGRESFIF